MTPKLISNYIRRIKKAEATLSCMGALILDLEIDAMTAEERSTLKAALDAKGIRYAYLTSAIRRHETLHGAVAS